MNQEIQKTVAQKAQAQNDNELAHAKKLFTLRLILCYLFALLAFLGLVESQGSGVWFAIPSAGIALIFLLLALDARSHAREVSGRKWTSLTPRFSNRNTATPTDRETTESAVNSGSV